MPPRHRHHHGGRFRGRRGFGGGPTYVIEEVPVPVYDEAVLLPVDLDMMLLPPPEKRHEKVPGAGMTFFENNRDAGDIIPTFVTPEDAKRYMVEVDSGYARMDSAVQSSNAPSDFKLSWGLQISSWKAFFLSAMATVGWLNTKAVMEQTDRYAAQLADWRKSFSTVGGTVPGPNPLPPGQGIPGTGPSSSDITKIIVATGVVAAIVILGPRLAKHL